MADEMKKQEVEKKAEKRIVTFKRAGKIILAFIVFVGLVIGVPLLINWCYQSDIVLIRTQWDADTVLNYYGAILGSLVTMSGLVFTIRFTMQQIRRDSYLKSESDKWDKIEAVISNILNEINPIFVLNQLADTGFTDPSSSTFSFQKFQISCRTAIDQLNAYLSTADYPKIKVLIDKIADVADKFFQISQKEIDQYQKQQELKHEGIASKLLSMEERYPGSLSAKEVAEYYTIIQTAPNIRFDDIVDALKQLNEEFIHIYETDYRELLQLKGSTFETIRIQTLNNADSILSLWRK